MPISRLGRVVFSLRKRQERLMDRVLLSRQPICAGDMSTWAYELLFRDSEADQATFRDEDEATAQVVVNTFMEIGLQEMVGPHLAFINVSPKFITSDFCE